MRRWGLHILSACSFVLFTSILFVLIRSFFVGDLLIWSEEQKIHGEEVAISSGIEVNFGSLLVSHSHYIMEHIHRPRLPGPFTWYRQEPQRDMGYIAPDDEVFVDMLGLRIVRRFQRRTVLVERRPGSHTGVPYGEKLSAGWYFKFPLWLPTLLMAILPGLWLRGAWEKRRLSHVGFCGKCGYDLRATPDRCPECGTVPRAE